LNGRGIEVNHRRTQREERVKRGKVKGKRKTEVESSRSSLPLFPFYPFPLLPFLRALRGEFPVLRLSTSYRTAIEFFIATFSSSLTYGLTAETSVVAFKVRSEPSA
jgi:hypothetical protein